MSNDVSLIFVENIEILMVKRNFVNSISYFKITIIIILKNQEKMYWIHFLDFL